MIEVKITKTMLTRAKKKAKEMGVIKNSILSGEGNLAGFLGEEVANRILRGKINNTYDYDIVCGEKKYDVKTKRCTSPPKPYYECSVAKYNTKQGCDSYCFVRKEYKNGKWGRAWYLGEKDKESFYKGAKELKKGQVDPDNNFVVKADCFNLAIKDLKINY